LLGWLSKYAKVKIWQIMILDVIWFTTISCQPLTFVAKSMVTFLPNFYLQNLLHDKNCDKPSKSWKKNTMINNFLLQTKRQLTYVLPNL